VGNVLLLLVRRALARHLHPQQGRRLFVVSILFSANLLRLRRRRAPLEEKVQI